MHGCVVCLSKFPTLHTKMDQDGDGYVNFDRVSFTFVVFLHYGAKGTIPQDTESELNEF